MAGFSGGAPPAITLVNKMYHLKFHAQMYGIQQCQLVAPECQLVPNITFFVAF